MVLGTAHPEGLVPFTGLHSQPQPFNWDIPGLRQTYLWDFLNHHTGCEFMSRIKSYVQENKVRISSVCKTECGIFPCPQLVNMSIESIQRQHFYKAL